MGERRNKERLVRDGDINLCYTLTRGSSCTQNGGKKENPDVTIECGAARSNNYRKYQIQCLSDLNSLFRRRSGETAFKGPHPL